MKPHTLVVRAVSISVLATLSGCGLLSSADSGVTDVPDASDASTYGLLPGSVVLGPTFTPMDLSVDGDRVIVLGRRSTDLSSFEGIGDAYLAVSDDRARSFRVLTVPGGQFATLHPFAVQSGHGRTWMLLARDANFAESVIREVDLASGTLGSPQSFDVTSFHLSPDALSGVALNGHSTVTLRFDVATGRLDRHTSATAPTEAHCTYADHFVSADGSTFLRACYGITDRCVQRIHVADASYQEVCTGWRDWTIPWGDRQIDVVLDGQPRRLSAERARVMSRTLEASGPAPGVSGLLDLGAGLLQGVVEPVGGARRGEIVRMDDSTGPVVHHRFVALRAGMAVSLPIPESPCTSMACNDATHFGLLEMRIARRTAVAGEWIIAYASLGPGGVARVYHEGEAPMGLFMPPSDAPAGVGGYWVPVQPGDTDLERACALAVSCPSPYPMTMGGCLEYWDRVRAPDPAHDPAFQRFVATAHGDCAALVDTFPAQFAGDRSTPQCLTGNRAFSTGTETTATAVFGQVRECAAEGATCVVSGSTAGCSVTGGVCDTCDASGRAILCDRGSAPREVVDCAARGLSCAVGSGMPACTTGVFRGVPDTCSNGRYTRVDASGNVLDTRDCNRDRLPCQTGAVSGCTWSGASGGGMCDQRAVTTCSGSLLNWCAGTYERFVDCAEIGGSGCSNGRCVFP